MKKFLTKIVLALTLSLSFSMAAQALDINTLIPKIGGLTNSTVLNKYKELGYVKDLPDITYQAAIATAIKTILQMAMSLSIIALVVAGIYYIQARGQEEDLTKAKDIMLYLVIGMAIMAAAYGVVAGFTQFDFFK